MKVITAGYSYLDIDAYAGIVAYTELLRGLGVSAQAVSTALPNGSVPEYLMDGSDIHRGEDFKHSDDDRFVIIDVSNPDFFDKFVDISKVVAVFDHHKGFEKYWLEQINDGAIIEFIGAACTLIVEEWEQAGMLDQMNERTAWLLAAGILDNTLHFKAQITTDRDKAAYQKVSELGKIESNFVQEYFESCDEQIKRDVVLALENDRKDYQFQNADFTVAIGQITAWDAKKFIEENIDKMYEFGKQTNSKWFVNVLSINEGFSYFVANDESVKLVLAKLFNVEFDGDVAQASRLWLRKEMFRHDTEVGIKR